MSPVAATVTTFNGSITGTATRGIALEKAGAAASYVILGGANTLTGATLVRGGALGLGNPAGVSMNGSVVLGNGTAETFLIAAAPAQQFGPASVIAFSNGALNAKFQLRGTSQTVAGLDATPAQALAILQNDELTTPGYVATPGPGVLTIDAATDHSFYGIMRDRISTISLVKNGVGAQELINRPDLVGFTFTGPTTINDGKLILNLSGATGLAWGSPITINAPGNLTVKSPAAGTGRINPFISGNGSLTKEGAGAIVLGGADDIGGTVAVTEGTLVVAANLNVGALAIADGATVILSSTGAAPAGNAFGENLEAPFAESASTAVPEPGSAVLLFGSTLALLGVRRRLRV